MSKPIGVFDSGVGGLTVTKEIMRQLPNESIYFFGDVKNCPYGDKTKEEIIQHTDTAVNFLVSRGVKLVVIACNTATAAALETLREKYSVPIIGVIKPGAITALQTTNSGKVLVLGTNFTAKSKAYSNEIHKINRNITVYNKACQTFVPYVENKNYDDPIETTELIHNELKECKNLEFDTIILGCTHYPLLQKYIDAYFDNQKMVISSGRETAREVSSILTFLDLHNTTGDKEYSFFITNKNNKFIETAEKWLNMEVHAEIVNTI
ncbi:MAG: glutamate racemase [Gemella sp.]|nr:glutamate racemase [Gemella sp.]